MIYMYVVPYMVGFLQSTLIKTIVIIHVSPTCWWSLKGHGHDPVMHIRFVALR